MLDLPMKRQLAVNASCDPRTIDKVARGERVRGLAYYRARAALIAAGFPVPEPAPASARSGARP
jgi:hypothetical protein